MPIEKKVIEGIGYCMVGPECDMINLTNGLCIGAHDLLPESVEDSVPSSIEYELNGRNKETWDEIRETWRKENNRQFPKLYRIKVTTEYEEIPNAESDVWWKEQQKRFTR